MQKAELDETLKLVALHKEELEVIKTNNKEIQEVKSKEFLEFQDKLRKEKENEIEKMEHIYKVNNFRRDILHYLDTPSGNVKSLSIEPHKLYIYCVKYINTRYGETVIVATNIESKKISNVFNLYWGNSKCKEFVDKFKDVWRFTRPNIIIFTTNKSLAILQVTGTYYSRSRNLCVNVDISPVIIEATNNITKQEEQIEQQIQQIEKEQEEARENSPMLIRKEGLTSKISIEYVVKEGDKVFVTAYYHYRKSDIIECKINGREKQLLKSNRFFDHILDNTNSKFTVMVEIRKLHPAT